MSCAYTAIHDCFYGVLRRKDIKQRAARDSVSRPTTYSGDIDVTLAEWQEDLEAYLPDLRDNTTKDKLHLCIATVAWILVVAVNRELVFGSPYTEQIEAATICWEKMPGECTRQNASRAGKEPNHAVEPQNSETRRKVTQWLSLTREILTDKDRESMDSARGYILEDVLDRAQEFLEALTDFIISDEIREELSEALAPFLGTMCMLPYQRWQYSFEMVCAVNEEFYTSFDPMEMEGMYTEKTGWIKASLFPQLCRLEGSGRDEDFTRTVICKARVAVQAGLRGTADGSRKDTKMSEDIHEGAKTDMEKSGEEVTGKSLSIIEPDKSLEIVEPQKSQSQDQDDVMAKDVGEPMDEDSLIDALRAGNVIYIDGSMTPEGGASESVIPDSYDRAEEETLESTEVDDRFYLKQHSREPTTKQLQSDQPNFSIEQPHRFTTACVSSPAKKNESVVRGTSQRDMYPTTMQDQLDEHLHFQETDDHIRTADMATRIVPATPQYATSIARVNHQSATLAVILEWSRDDVHHWLPHKSRTMSETP
ncbi:unnamed protein product, partial [Aureobasidium uvarum]